MTLDATYGLVSQCLIAAGAICLVRDLASPSRRRSLVTDLVLPSLIVALVPIGGIPIAAHLRGLWGDPSVITAVLLATLLISPSRLPCRPPRAITGILVVFYFLPLYLPLFLGWGRVGVDLYSLGWRPWGLLSLVVAAAFVGWRLLDLRWIRLVAFALLGYGIGLLESTNLFDYLVDPGLAIGLVVATLVTRRSQSASSAVAPIASN